MILIVGTKDDLTIKYFQKYLTQNMRLFVFLNQNNIGIEYHLDLDGIHYNNGLFIAFSSITGVFNRARDLNPRYKYPKKLYSNLGLLFYILDTTFNNVVNRSDTTGSNISKPYQLRFYKRKNIKIPKSTILANTIPLGFHESTIYKSTSSERSIVKEINPVDSLRQVTCPVLFQKNICGTNIRAHVVGKEVFSLAITSDTIDYRYSKNKTRFEEVELPSSISRECADITKQNNFLFSGIDLIKTTRGYYFLEANPSPGYHYFEKHMNEKKISFALMNILAKRSIK